MPLAVCYITSRQEPRIEWFFDSLRNENTNVTQIIVVDLFADQYGRKEYFRKLAGREIDHVLPKPSVWQGVHRLTKDHWWAASNARNTALCLARTDYVAYVDDRCVLMPGYLTHIKESIMRGRAIFGSYQKRIGMKVENGVIVKDGISEGIVDGSDTREAYLTQNQIPAPFECPGAWSFGCNLAFPLEWALEINGWDETCDGAGFEDPFFGIMLQNSGKKALFYEPRMKVIQDRTSKECYPVIKKTDKGISPNDKSHAMLDRLKAKKRATHSWDLRAIRESVLRGEPFPIPTGPTHDWYDGQPLAEMVV